MNAVSKWKMKDLATDHGCGCEALREINGIEFIIDNWFIDRYSSWQQRLKQNVLEAMQSLFSGSQLTRHYFVIVD